MRGVFWYTKSMKKRRQYYLTISLGTILCVAMLHILATRIGLYYIFPWYDSVLHFLGGVALGFFGLFLFRTYGYLQTIGLTLGLAVIWEIFEYVGNQWFPVYVGFIYSRDTITDIGCAILGTLISIIITYIWQNNNTTHT